MTYRGKAHEAIIAELVDQIKKEGSVQTLVVESYKNLKGISGTTHQFDVYWEFRTRGKTHRCANRGEILGQTSQSTRTQQIPKSSQ